MNLPNIYIGSPYSISLKSQDSSESLSGNIIVRVRSNSVNRYFQAVEDTSGSYGEGVCCFVFDTSNMIVGRYTLEVLNTTDGTTPTTMRQVFNDLLLAEKCSMTNGFTPDQQE